MVDLTDGLATNSAMVAIFLKTLPFFALIGLGYWACRIKFFSEEATAYLTKFVFYFALSAMLFGFTSTLSVSEIFDLDFALAYLIGTTVIYLLVLAVALYRKVGMEVASIEAQCGVIGNVGFLGIPMLVVLLGEAAVGPVIMILSIDLIVFSSLIVILITMARQSQTGFALFRALFMGLLNNPMIVAISLGIIVSLLGVTVPGPLEEFLSILGAAATPCALFAIGASLASKSAERVSVAAWLSFAKLVLHPLAVAVTALLIFTVEPFAAKVMIATAALPVAGNIYILAQHYGIAPQRASASILLSTIVSVMSVTIVVALLQG